VASWGLSENDHFSPDRKLSVIDRIASTAIETAAGREQPLVKSGFQSAKLFLAPGGGSDFRFILIQNKLLKILDAKNYQNAGNAVLEYATSTRDLDG
jgi:hypothetical protein